MYFQVKTMALDKQSDSYINLTDFEETCKTVF